MIRLKLCFTTGGDLKGMLMCKISVNVTLPEFI